MRPLYTRLLPLPQGLSLAGEVPCVFRATQVAAGSPHGGTGSPRKWLSVADLGSICRRGIGVLVAARTVRVAARSVTVTAHQPHLVATSPAALGFHSNLEETASMSNASRCARYQANQKELFAELQRRVEQLEAENKALSAKFDRLKLIEMSDCILIPHLGGVQ